jgi:hypothetical protein
MPSPHLSVRISPPLLERLESFVDQRNITVSEGVIAAIACYIGETEGVSLVERMRQVEKRLAWLEIIFLYPEHFLQGGYFRMQVMR